jgi:hypothetical protein
MCTASDDVSKNQCEFYILGVAQGADLASAAAPTKDKAHCISIPAGMNYASIVLAVKMKMGQDLMVFPRRPEFTGCFGSSSGACQHLPLREKVALTRAADPIGPVAPQCHFYLAPTRIWPLPIFHNRSTRRHDR